MLDEDNHIEDTPGILRRGWSAINRGLESFKDLVLPSKDPEPAPEPKVIYCLWSHTSSMVPELMEDIRQKLDQNPTANKLRVLSEFVGGESQFRKNLATLIEYSINDHTGETFESLEELLVEHLGKHESMLMLSKARELGRLSYESGLEVSFDFIDLDRDHHEYHLSDAYDDAINSYEATMNEERRVLVGRKASRQLRDEVLDAARRWIVAGAETVDSRDRIQREQISLMVQDAQPDELFIVMIGATHVGAARPVKTEEGEIVTEHLVRTLPEALVKDLDLPFQYTTPHLGDVQMRRVINGHDLSEEDLIKTVMATSLAAVVRERFKGIESEYLTAEAIEAGEVDIETPDILASFMIQKADEQDILQLFEDAFDQQMVYQKSALQLLKPRLLDWLVSEMIDLDSKAVPRSLRKYLLNRF